MTSNSINRFLTSEDGWATPFSLMFVAGMFTMLGVTVEYANIVYSKSKLQSATDAVALAAVQAMPDEELALEYALAVADKYFNHLQKNFILLFTIKSTKKCNKKIFI